MKFSIKTYVITGLAFVAAIALIIWAIMAKRSSPTEINYSVSPKPQAVKKRKWRDINFQYVGHSKLFLQPLSIRKGPLNDFYITDYADMRVKEIDMRGDTVRSFGRGGGKGPGEMGNITSVAFAPSGDAWIVDAPTSKITIFNADTFKTIKTNQIPKRAVPFNNNRYVYKSKFDSRPAVKTLSGKTISTFEPLVQRPDLWSWGLESYFLKDHEGGIVRLNNYLNSIVRYDSTGHILYFRKSIGSPPPPKFHPPQKNRLHVRFNTVNQSTVLQASEDISLINNQIQVLVSKKKSGGVQEFVDVYSLQKGDYMYSYHLPDTLRSIAVTSHHLAGLPIDSTYVMIWSNKTGW